jgi:glycosyltransferase involved in cell wall biosynthesis
MKIIIVSAQYIGSVSGGGGVHVIELTRELGKLGHDITVLSMGLGRYKNKETVILEDPHNPNKKMRKARIKIQRFRVKDSAKLSSPFEGTKQQEIDRLLEFRNKVRDHLIKHNGKELLHVHGHFVVPAIARELKEAGTKYKIVNSIHTVESISEIKKGKDGAGPKFIKIMQEMEKEAMLFSDHVILRSNKVKQQVSKYFPQTVKKTKITVVSSGVSSVFINEPQWNEKQLNAIRKKYKIQGDLIFNINRIDPSKGIENLIKAYPRIYKYMQKKHGKDYKLSVIIAGMIEKKNIWYYKRLVKLMKGIKAKEIRNSIAIYQNISEKDKTGIFNLAKIFVLTSLLEPFGITIVEALAKNIPVVCSGVEGPMDIMDTKNVKSPYSPAPGGVLVHYKEPAKRANNFLQAFQYVYDHPKEIEKSVLKGKNKTLKKYAWESLVKEKIKIYKNV